MAKKSKGLKFNADAAQKVIQAQLASLKSQTSGATQLASDYAFRNYGFGPPQGIASLPMGFLLGTNVWNMQRIHQISGDPASMKSSLCFEFIRWVLSAGGKAVLVDTERKISAGMMKAQLSVEHLDMLIHEPVDFLEDAQRAASRHIDFAKAQLSKGVVIPTIIVIDSIAGANLEKADKEMQKEGHAKEASYDAARAANSMGTWLRSAVSWLVNTPVVLFFVNHDKEDMSAFSPNPNIKIKKQLGGKAVKFHCTNQISNTRLGNSHPIGKYARDEAKGMDARVIQLQTIKCGTGPDGRKVIVPVRWFYKEDGSQQLWWDWNLATPYLLKSIVEDAAYANFSKRVRDMVPFTVDKNRWSCPSLGLDKVIPEEFGAALYSPENAQVVRDLETALGIEKGNRFEDYEYE